MKHSLASTVKRQWHHTMRRAFSILPRSIRFALYRSFVDCDPKPDPRLTLQIADTKEELEACFKLLHDAYVSSGFMKPDPSGLRATLYHALPTTTTLCAKYDGEVVGTISLIRESALGFPLQSVFDLEDLRSKGGKLAEVSALAVHPKFRKTGGFILFPLMKFMYQYSFNYFDTRHLVIAVNPDRIEMYESLLSFQRLEQSEVDNYDFANGAPAVGASLDLSTFASTLERVYGKKPLRKNLHHYFCQNQMANIAMPDRRYFTTNDPVMTPDLLDYFFNQRTATFSTLGPREHALLHSIYNTERYSKVVPEKPSDSDFNDRQRHHQRYSLKCPGNFFYTGKEGTANIALRVIEISDAGFLALAKDPLPMNLWGSATVQLGNNEKSTLKAMVTRVKRKGSSVLYGFKIEEPDLAWRKFVGVLKSGSTHKDLANATRFLED